MASFFHKFLLIFPFTLLISGSLSVSLNPILPKAAIFPVTKDSSTLQYVAQLFIGQNLAPVDLVLDVNAPFVWMDCEFNTPFSSHQPVKGRSLECSMAKSSSGCTKNGVGVEYDSKICALTAENTLTRVSASGILSQDKLAVEFWDGKNSGSLAKNGGFLFSCASSLLLKGLADGAKGMLGLGNSRISLSSQVSSAFGFFQRKFSLCLSPSKGAIYLGGSPFGSEISSAMMYTPLISKKNGFQNGYYLNVKSIKISGKKLSLPQKGILETKISTVVPYTTMERKLYGVFVDAYVRAAGAMNLTLVPPVSPFGVCFSSKGVESKRVGPNVPVVDVFLQSEMVKWKFYGRNLMVPVSEETMCLGILDGGLSPRDAIVIGGYQLEDYLLEFNLENSMFGFSSSLLMGQKKCSDFEPSTLSKELI